MGVDLHRAVDALPGLVWIASADGRLDFVNRRWCDYTGISREERSADGWLRGVHPDDQAMAFAAWQSCLDSGEAGNAEARMRRYDGVYRRFLLQISPVRDESGNVLQWCSLSTDIEDYKRAEALLAGEKRVLEKVGQGLPVLDDLCQWVDAIDSDCRSGIVEYIGAIQDVTERRQSEEALNQLRIELVHVSRVNNLGALTASIAHEINQPLAGIMTNANTGLRMLGAEPPNVEGARETVRRTLRDGRRAAELMARLRALFSKKMISNEAVDLPEAVHEVAELLRTEIRRNRVVMQLEASEDLPKVAGDRVQLQQVILNLLINAIEAMRGVKDRLRQLSVKINRDGGDRVRVAVTDSGTGIDRDQAAKLFDAFYTTKKSGMGIGLSVCRTIVESHGGRLWATPNDGPGATFSFSVPIRASSLAIEHADDAGHEGRTL